MLETFEIELLKSNASLAVQIADLRDERDDLLARIAADNTANAISFESQSTVINAHASQLTDVEFIADRCQRTTQETRARLNETDRLVDRHANALFSIVILSLGMLVIRLVYFAAWIRRGLKHWAIVLAVVAAGSSTARADIRTAIDATVRISANQGIGSGIVFEVTDQAIYALTNAHVVSADDGPKVIPAPIGSPAQVEFWIHGHNSQPVTGQVVFLDYVEGTARDIAVVAVDRQQTNGWAPTPIPFAREGTTLRVDDEVLSIGCAKGAWPSGFVGHVVETGSTRLEFLPPVANGRSGSALLTPDGRAIVGLVAWRMGDETQGQELTGGALTLEEIDRAARGQPPQRAKTVRYQKNASRRVPADDEFRSAKLSQENAAQVGPIDFTSEADRPALQDDTICPGGVCPAPGPYYYQQPPQYSRPAPTTPATPPKKNGIPFPLPRVGPEKTDPAPSAPKDEAPTPRPIDPPLYPTPTLPIQPRPTTPPAAAAPWLDAAATAVIGKALIYFGLPTGGASIAAWLILRAGRRAIDRRLAQPPATSSQRMRKSRETIRTEPQPREPDVIYVDQEQPAAQRIIIRQREKPLPQVVTREREFVQVETPTIELRALQQALDIYGKKNPGAIPVIETLESMAEQIAAGLRAERKTA